MILMCDTCYTLFEDTDKLRRDEFGYIEMECPLCMRGDLEQAIQCEVCEEYFINIDSVCDDCLKDKGGSDDE